MRTFTAIAPGRVNLIGDHTDYTGGLCFPMAIDRFTQIRGTATLGNVELTSADIDGTACFDLPIDDPSTLEPAWGRYVAGVAAEMATTIGCVGQVSTSIPVGAGLSSSAALSLATAFALGFDGEPLQLAQLCRTAERRATGVPTGILDQLSIAAANEGHAMILDCDALSVTHVRLPHDVDVVVQFVAHRTLVGSAYADRVAECAAAERIIGPLRQASVVDLAGIADDTIRRRARHVVTENQRVLDFADALASNDLASAGELMVSGHRSLAVDYATSTPQMDAAVDALVATPGVYGARMTGGGFGGCVVAICEPGALTAGWIVKPAGGARRIDDA